MKKAKDPGPSIEEALQMLEKRRSELMSYPERRHFR
jgi:hypothetical protein